MHLKSTVGTVVSLFVMTETHTICEICWHAVNTLVVIIFNQKICRKGKITFLQNKYSSKTKITHGFLVNEG